MKNSLLLIAISLGAALPYGSDYVFLIRYFLMVLLFFSFLNIKAGKEIIRKSHFVILAIILSSPLILFYLINPFNHSLAQTVFVTAIAPTAIAAPVIISLKKGNVEYVMFSLMLNNIAVALLIPFLIPLVAFGSSQVRVNDILFPVLVTIFIPLALAQLIRFSLPAIWKKLVEWKDSSFYILVANIYIAVSDASTYIREELTSNLPIVFLIALVSALLCFFYFGLGWLLGGKNLRAEASQSLGQKNNAFTIWIAITFISPLAALGPVFYVLFQNTYISYTLYKFNKKLHDEQV
ncbi:MAG: sodium-dependent transporter [Ignavibacteria bacterium]|nr:MAG: sodium-dependent transporter [Ignavibacteria bacterium]KAF0156133.1 MAG: sodium-dependent transporter [Ignavibacteria bacterium]